MRNLPHFFFIAILLALVACTDDIPIEPTPDVLGTQIEPRSANSFPDVIFLPTGFEAEGIEIGHGNDVYVTAISYSPNPVLLGAIWKGDLLTGEGDILAPPDGTPSVGIKFDARTNWLFVCKPFGANIVNASSGDIVHQSFFADPAALINDVVVTKEAAYFTDSNNPRIYKLPLLPNGQLGGPAEEIPLPGFQYVFDPAFFGINMNGIAASPNGRYLIVNNMTTGIFYRIDTQDDYSTQAIDIPNQVPEYFQWGDGLLLDGKDLYVCQNLPNKIAVMHLAPNFLSGEFVKDITSMDFNEPATIADKGSHIYAVNAYFFESLVLGIDPVTLTMDIIRVDK